MTTSSRTCLQWLVLAVIALPMLVPAGYMVHRNAETGTLEIVLCQGMGPASNNSNPDISIDVDGHHHHHHHNHGTSDKSGIGSQDQAESSQELCPFAVATAVAVESQHSGSTEAIDAGSFQQQQSQDHPTARAVLPPSRGPPVIS